MWLLHNLTLLLLNFLLSLILAPNPIDPLGPKFPAPETRARLVRALAEGMKHTLVKDQEWALIFLATLAAALTSELTSNPASAQLIVPAVIGYSQAIGVDPVGPGLAATFGSSLGFMLPVSTPCNAIVYGSGLVPIGRMVRYGLLLDLVGVLVVAYNAATTLASVLDRIPPSMRSRIEEVIVSAQYHVFPGTAFTVCALTLRNGFIVIGESACASIENFNEEIGSCTTDP